LSFSQGRKLNGGLGMLIWFAMVNIYIYMIIERYYYGDPGVDPKVVINYGDETIMC
jgi:hypothetical protein